MWDLNTIKKINTDEQIMKRIRHARRMNRLRHAKKKEINKEH